MLIDMLRPLYTDDTGATTDQASAETKNTDADQQEHMIPKSRFDEVNKQAHDLAEWKKKREAADAKQAADAKLAADAAAQEKGEFERLASERAARITEIERERDAIQTERESSASVLTSYQEAMERQIKARLKLLPDEIAAMAPEGDALVRYDWLAKAETAAAKLATAARPPLGTPPGPRGPGTASATQPVDLAAQKRASGDYAM